MSIDSTVSTSIRVFQVPRRQTFMLAGSLRTMTTGPSWGALGGHGPRCSRPFAAWRMTSISADAPYHARGGSIPVYRAPIAQWGHLDRAFRTAALDLGYPWTEGSVSKVEMD